MKKLNLIFITVAILCVCLSSCGATTSNISSIEKVENYIEGKTFTATPTGSGQLWYKVSFSNGRYTFWTAHPTSGSWGSPKGSGSVDVSTRRYVDTGQQYFYVRLETESILFCTQFIISDLSFVNCNAYDSSDRAKASVGNKNPW